jgi:NADH:ubiquinone oxidoreductase subunit K
MIPLAYSLYLSAFLFCLGLLFVLVKRHTLLMLMGIELMLNAVNINFVAFNQYDTSADGAIFALFVMVVAAAEVAVALALLINLYHYVRHTDPSKFDKLRD